MCLLGAGCTLRAPGKALQPPNVSSAEVLLSPSLLSQLESAGCVCEAQSQDERLAWVSGGGVGVAGFRMEGRTCHCLGLMTFIAQ